MLGYKIIIKLYSLRHEPVSSCGQERISSLGTTVQNQGPFRGFMPSYSKGNLSAGCWNKDSIDLLCMDGCVAP